MTSPAQGIGCSLAPNNTCKLTLPYSVLSTPYLPTQKVRPRGERAHSRNTTTGLSLFYSTVRSIHTLPIYCFICVFRRHTFHDIIPKLHALSSLDPWSSQSFFSLPVHCYLAPPAVWNISLISTWTVLVVYINIDPPIL